MQNWIKLKITGISTSCKVQFIIWIHSLDMKKWKILQFQRSQRNWTYCMFFLICDSLDLVGIDVLGVWFTGFSLKTERNSNSSLKVSPASFNLWYLFSDWIKIERNFPCKLWPVNRDFDSNKTFHLCALPYLQLKVGLILFRET